ncbi:uncharacterized protein LOC121062058 isoform X3 [Cygnus olor]|uniref:uncharacterized protein LOC121062058 isoform X3 n=1 Tax=Cygnus olor TaxID=8869 RepID=UPI001ADE7328|nr:uncharacterized protein LOC121062058 isoform X3 [Cygnus olor]
MKHYLLFSPLKPEELSLIKELTSKVETLVAPLDFGQIASDIRFRPQIVEQCIHETLLLFAGALLEEKDVEFFFKGIGILTVRRKVVTMNFYTEFLLEVDGTNNMYEALLTDSKMMDMIAFDGKNKYTRISGNSFITLPTLILQNPHCNPISIKPKRDPQPWGTGGRRVSVLDPVVLAQRRVSLAKMAEKKRKEDKTKQGDQARFEPPIHERSEEELKKPKPPAHPQPKPPERLDNPQDPPTTRAPSVRARMEERRHRILMAHERKELEDEIWGEYDAILRSRSREREKNPVYHLLECGRRPSCLLRKEYDKKLKERMKENVGGQSPVSQKASDGWKEEPQLPRFEPPICERSEKDLKKPKPPAHPQPKPPERLGFSAQKTATTGVYYMRTLREERRERILTANRLKRIQADSWDKYDSSMQKLIFEQRQKNFHHTVDCDQRPSFLLRKEYNEKLKERLNPNVKGQSPVSRKATERGQEEPQLPRRAQREKGEKTRLLDHHGKAQGVPSTPGNHERPCSFQLQRP